MVSCWRIVGVAVLLAAFVVVVPRQAVLAAGTVGDGSPGSCSEFNLNAAIAGGGLVEFNCPEDEQTIILTEEITIGADTQIDGGGVITISGGNEVRIFVVGSGVSLRLAGITLTNGYADNDEGGAIFSEGPLEIVDSVVKNSVADIWGGGISAYDELILINSEVSGNSADFSGGIDSFSTVTIADSTIAGNTAAEHGGGIFINGGGVEITNSTISGNAAGEGGGIHNYDGDVTITSSTISGNTATDEGGGVYDYNIMTISNSTISGNSSSGDGGGIFKADWDEELYIVNSTISGNSAGSDGGGIYNDQTVTLVNTIVADSASGGNCFNTNTSVISSAGGNLSDDASCSGFFTEATDQNEVDALLGALADNGGPTLTHMPEADSPAIDAAVSSECPAEDQRGMFRPASACDTGSVEAIPTTDFCVSRSTGALSLANGGACAGNESELVLPDITSVTLCISRSNRAVSLRNPCPGSWNYHIVPDDGPFEYCVSRHSGAIRAMPASGCAGNERAGVIPGVEG